MNKNKVTIAAIGMIMAMASACNNNGGQPAGETHKDTVSAAAATAAAEQPLDSATMMKRWMEYMTPGEMHQMMAAGDGTWDATTTMWMSADAPPTMSKGKSVNRMILGGRYQEIRHTGDFNGMPFEGIGTVGYDNAREVFVSTWVDNMGTGIMYLEGTWDEASKSIVMKGTQKDCMTDKNTAVREVLKMTDNNNQVMEMYITPEGGKEYKCMEIKYTRKGA